MPRMVGVRLIVAVPLAAVTAVGVVVVPLGAVTVNVTEAPLSGPAGGDVRVSVALTDNAAAPRVVVVGRVPSDSCEAIAETVNVEFADAAVLTTLPA